MSSAAIYIAELQDELARLGPQRFVQSRPHPVLIVSGLAGTLAGPATTGTVVAQSSDTVLLGTLVGRVFPLVKGKFSPPGPIVVGRTADADVAIPEYSISKQHCRISVAGEVRLVDCGSTNGTLINGVPVPPRQGRVLTGGETLTLGRFMLLFHRPAGLVEYLRALP